MYADFFTPDCHRFFRSLSYRSGGISNYIRLKAFNSCIVGCGTDTIIECESAREDLGNLIISEYRLELSLFRKGSESWVALNSLQESLAHYYIWGLYLQILVKLSTLGPLNTVNRPHHLRLSSVMQRYILEQFGPRIIGLEWTMRCEVIISCEHDQGEARVLLQLIY